MNNLKRGFCLHGQTAPIAALLALMMASPAAAQDDTAPATARPAKVTTVQQQATGLRRQYPAIVYPSQEAVLSFRVSGQVTSLPVRAATGLKRGDIIAELDKRDFETAVARLKSQNDQAQAQLDALIKGARAEEIVALQAAVYASQARVDQATEQLARTSELFDKDIVSQAQLEKDEANVRVMQAELRTSEEQLSIGRSGGREEDVEAAEAVLRGLQADLKNASDNLADATLRAPFDGVVARRNIDNFTNVIAGDPIVLLQNLSTVDLVFDVPGSDVLTWTALDWDDLKVEVALTGSNVSLKASELIEFSTQADAGTQTYQARISVLVPDKVIALAGMVGSVRISSLNSTVVQPSVPITALGTTPEGAPFVWVVDPTSNAVSAHPVTPGDITGDQVLILEGVTAGDMIVTAGVSRLSENLVIRPITKVGN